MTKPDNSDTHTDIEQLATRQPRRGSRRSSAGSTPAQAGLRETLELVREGRALIEFCAAELDAVGGELEELRLDELVARLEGAAAEQ